MKKLLILALALVMVLSLAACTGGDTPEQTDPETTTQEANDNTTSDTAPAPSDTEAPSTEAPQATPGEVADFDIGISTIPTEWQKAIGNSLYGMNTGAMGDCSDSYTNKFGGVSADDYAKLIAYYDTLSYTEKLDGVYNCDWGQLQISHNPDASEMTITWCAN